MPIRIAAFLAAGKRAAPAPFDKREDAFDGRTPPLRSRGVFLTEEV
jgi:hypothetical protein